MRVSDSGNKQQVSGAMQRNRAKLKEIHIKGSSGKRINSPKDDPVGNATLQNMRTQNANNKQFERNIVLARTFMNYSDAALEDLGELVVRAKELAVQQASGGTQTPETRMAIAQDVDQLFLQALNIGNRRLGDRYVFGGFQSHQSPFLPDGTYRGDDGQIKVEIEKGIYLDINVPGNMVFLKKAEDGVMGQASPVEPWNELLQKNPDEMTEEERELASVRIKTNNDQKLSKNEQGANLFRELRAFKVGLMTGDIPLIQGTLDSFDEILKQIVNTRARIGSRANSLDFSEGNVSREVLHNQEVQARIEDVDMLKLSSDLKQTEQALQAGIEMGKRLVQPSLMDFLR
jgi:flagellar hook-associated protein 3 FlgL